eukprot:PhF_6_TR2222/c0_g1_i3/m.3714
MAMKNWFDNKLFQNLRYGDIAVPWCNTDLSENAVPRVIRGLCMLARADGVFNGLFERIASFRDTRKILENISVMIQSQVKELHTLSLKIMEAVLLPRLLEDGDTRGLIIAIDGIVAGQINLSQAVLDRMDEVLQKLFFSDSETEIMMSVMTRHYQLREVAGKMTCNRLQLAANMFKQNNCYNTFASVLCGSLVTSSSVKNLELRQTILTSVTKHLSQDVTPRHLSTGFCAKVALSLCTAGRCLLEASDELKTLQDTYLRALVDKVDEETEFGEVTRAAAMNLPKDVHNKVLDRLEVILSEDLP